MLKCCFGCILDIDQRRLDIAKQMGADFILKVTSKVPQESANQIEDLMGEQPDVTIECSGATPSIQTAIYVSLDYCIVHIQCNRFFKAVK